MSKKKKLPEIDPELVNDLVGIKRNTGSKTRRNNSKENQPDTEPKIPKDKTKFLD